MRALNFFSATIFRSAACTASVLVLTPSTRAASSASRVSSLSDVIVTGIVPPPSVYIQYRRTVCIRQSATDGTDAERLARACTVVIGLFQGMLISRERTLAGTAVM